MTQQSRYLTPIKRGEYDLVNISLLGRDPITGQTYEECQAEWSAELEKLLPAEAELKWWQLGKRFALYRKLAALQSHLGM